MRSSKGILLLVVAFVLVLGACRRNQPSLIDRNQPPDTELWYVPADSTEYEYRVHIYWRGLDRDGTVVKYIWVKTDTIEALDEKRWNPAERLDDYRRGRLTTRTDSVFSFTAYRNIGGVGVKKNRQAFHVASIDDNGKIDPVPAAIEFVATIDRFPEMRFSTHIDSFYNDQMFPLPSRPYHISSIDTAGMYRPFAIGYHGSTMNGLVRAIRWFPISNIELRGAGEWTANLSDSLQYFVNDPDSFAWFQSLTSSEKLSIPLWRHYEVIPNGPFRIAAQCLDDADAESQVDAGRFTEGVCQVVVNHDPDTEVSNIINIFKRATGERDTVEIDFRDGKPDTVPFRSWITLHYRGWDNPGDRVLCQDDLNKCIKYQIQYHVSSARYHDLNFDTGLLPPQGPQDTNPCGVADSSSMSIGTGEYVIRVRAVDENGRVDGTPEVAWIGGAQGTSEINIVGNFDPTLDSLYMLDHKGRKIQSGDTLKWVWSEGEKDIDFEKGVFLTTFSFTIRAFGHDHPWELEGAGVKSWRYDFVSLDPPGMRRKFARSGGWVVGPRVNELDDVFQITFEHSSTDPNGDAIFQNPPEWIGVDYQGASTAVLWEMRLLGRDTGIGETFAEEIWLKRFELGEITCEDLPDLNEPISMRRTVNDYPTSRYGRNTEEGTVRFYFQLVQG